MGRTPNALQEPSLAPQPRTARIHPSRFGVRARRCLSGAALVFSIGLAVPATSDASSPQAPPSSAPAPAAAATPPGGPTEPILPPVERQPGAGQRDEPNRQTSSTSDAPVLTSPGASGATSGVSLVGTLGLGLLAAVSLVLTLVAATTLTWMLHAWRSSESLAATRFASPTRAPRRRFSLIVPARHEQAVLGDTLDSLAALDYPTFEVLAVIGHDDPQTEAVARAAEARHPGRVRVLLDHNVPKNKPKALNTALADCRGDVVGVFDAEDEVHTPSCCATSTPASATPAPTSCKAACSS